MDIKIIDEKTIEVNGFNIIVDGTDLSVYNIDNDECVYSNARKELNCHTGIEDINERLHHYYNDSNECIEFSDRFLNISSKNLYEQGLVTSNRQLAIDRDRAFRIRFALEKYASEHNKKAIDWSNLDQDKHHIVYDYVDRELKIYITSTIKNNNIYFDSYETALNAIEAVGANHVLWFYRDYQPYLNAYKEIKNIN